MAKSKTAIFTVGFDVPGDEFEHIEFDSVRTLLDAEIILFEPTLGEVDFAYGGGYNGTPTLNHTSGSNTYSAVNHWRSEITAAVNAGKLVVVFLAAPLRFYRYTGEKQYSGTGRSRVTTNMVTEICSYDAVPVLKRVVPKTGSTISLSKDAAIISDYWAEFFQHSAYAVEITCEDRMRPLLTVGDQRVVGASFKGSRGTLLFLPPLNTEDDSFLRIEGDETFWSDEAHQFGKRLATRLRALSKALRSGEATPPPAWAEGLEFRTDEEDALAREIAETDAKIETLQQLRTDQGAKLLAAGTLRHLLYEQGKPLERAVIEAMRLLGFDADGYDDGASEFDVVMTCAEGRCIGETEGKDNKAINIEKFGQLERNIQEDFAKDGVSEFAKGVLFGNAQRLIPLDKRAEFFTAKCVAAALRVKAALVRTPDLFAPARYLKEHPADKDYAASCRSAIFEASGEVVVFPSPPTASTIGPSKEG